MTTAAPDPAGDGDLYVIVPAVMGVGLLLSLLTLARDEVGRVRGHATRARHVAAWGHSAAVEVLDGTEVARRDRDGLRGRGRTAVLAVLLLALAGYLTPGATWNFFNPVNQMREMGWLWAISMTVVVLATALGLTLAAAALRWADLPAQARPVLLATSLTAAAAAPTPQAALGLRRRRLALASVTALLLFTVLAGLVALGPSEAVGDLLRRAAERLDALGALQRLHPLSHPGAGLAAGALLAPAVWRRCRPLAAALLVAPSAVWLLSVGTTRLVVPTGPDVVQDLTAVPSGVVAVAALMTGLVPLAALVLTRRRRPALAVAGVLGVGLVGVAVERMADPGHSPLDAVSGLLAAAAVGTAVLAVLVDPGRHVPCRRGCPWHPAVGAAAAAR